MPRFALLLALLFAAPLYASDCPRIVSQSPYITKSLQWLGLEECIVGVSRYDTLERPHTGGILDPDRDTLEALTPDLFLTSDWTTAETLATGIPTGTRLLRLNGFESMAQVEENLLVIGQAVGMADIETRVAQFHHQWRAAAAAIHGDGRRVLLISSCSGNPYSFGRQRWLADLFSAAGFVVVETEQKIRHINPDAEVKTLNALIDQLQPQLLFIFERSISPQCALLNPQVPVRVVTFDGEKFLHPAPVLLEGLEELAAKRQDWSI